MKIDTKSLTGTVLNWAVAVAQGLRSINDGNVGIERFSPVTELSGVDIMEQHTIGVEWTGFDWKATVFGSGVVAYGDTLLTSAMRAYVVYRFGDTIDIPDSMVEYFT